ncbi:MAG: hypothetical protein NTX25_03800 [Proteobacteria bacterium]|nr:hypothetical protein [Pseudomonadota bacterium]
MRINFCQLVFLPISMFGLLACGPKVSNSKSSIKELIDAPNSVDRFGLSLNYSYDPDVLPLRSKSEQAVWSGNWWPLSQGGTSAAMAKYDAAESQGNAAKAWENATVERSGHISWAGHCNGLAAAGINEQAPRHAVWYKGQNFSTDDIQALLVEKWQGISQVQLVGRRCGSESGTDSDGRLNQAACRDINPAAFHIILGNVLGLQKKPFIVDINVGEEVWNYPVVSYSSEVSGLSRAEANQAISGQSNSSYPWNPQAELFMLVKTRLKLATGAEMNLEYVLEGNNYQIVGGEWIGASKTLHPDFLWTTAHPDAPNPNLNLEVIDTIAAMS